MNFFNSKMDYVHMAICRDICNFVLHLTSNWYSAFALNYSFQCYRRLIQFSSAPIFSNFPTKFQSVSLCRCKCWSWFASAIILFAAVWSAVAIPTATTLSTRASLHATTTAYSTATKTATISATAAAAQSSPGDRSVWLEVQRFKCCKTVLFVTTQL